MAKTLKGLVIGDEMSDEGDCRRYEINQEETADEIKATIVSSTTLQVLPIEVLDYILMKAVVKKVMDRKLAKPAWIGYASRMIKPMRTVWSQWNNRLSTNWFKIVLSRTLNNKDATTISVTASFVKRSCFVSQDGCAKLGNKIYGLHKLPGRYWLGPEDGYELTVSTIEDMIGIGTVVITVHEIQSARGMVACKLSNSLYIWPHCGPAIWRLKLDANGSCDILHFTDVSPTSDIVELSGLSDKIHIDKISVLDDGSLLVVTYFYYKKDETVTILSVLKPDGLAVKHVKLSQNGVLSNVVMKSNGNFVYAQILKNGELTFREIDQDGGEIRDFKWFHKISYYDIGRRMKLFQDSDDRVIFQHSKYCLMFLDAELNFLQEVQFETHMTQLRLQFDIETPEENSDEEFGHSRKNVEESRIDVTYADFHKETNKMIIVYDKRNNYNWSHTADIVALHVKHEISIYS